ncbi:MAG: mechanosensitive ion channel family protein [Paracoccaceae bacterium]
MAKPGIAFTFTLGIFLSMAMFLPAVAQEVEGDLSPVQNAIEAAQNRELSVTDLASLMVPLTSDELSEVANVWQGYIHAALEESAHLNVALNNAAKSDAKPLRERLSALTAANSELQNLYDLVLVNWERKGANPDALKKHRDYVLAVQAAKVQTADPLTLLRAVGKWLVSSDGGLGVVLKLGGLLVAIWVMFFVSRIVRKFAHRGLERIPNLSRLLKTFVLGAVYWLTFALGVMVVLALIGVNITPLFAVLGGASFILGFALQETLGNLASGLMIMVLKPFDTGDYIQVAGTSGVVDDMSVVSTTIRTFDNQVITVPNSKIWGDVITNVSASATRRVDLVFGIGYDDDAAQAIEVLSEIVKSDGLCLNDPAAEIFVGELGDSSVNIFCRPWVKSDDYWTVYWGLTGKAKKQFDAEGISIPFPQRDVHIYQSGAEKP